MGQIPYGYRIENGAAVIIPAEAAQIRLIFQNYIAGMSLQSAARAAGHPMAHSTVRRMLQRKCYLGDSVIHFHHLACSFVCLCFGIGKP